MPAAEEIPLLLPLFRQETPRLQAHQLYASITAPGKPQQQQQQQQLAQQHESVSALRAQNAGSSGQPLTPASSFDSHLFLYRGLSLKVGAKGCTSLVIV